MTWFLGVLIVLVVGATVVVAVGRGGMRPVYDDRPDSLVPADSDLTGADLRTVRFSVGFRGYRMDEVDALLGRLAEQLDQPAERPDRPRDPAERLDQPAEQPDPPRDPADQREEHDAEERR